VDNVFHVLGVEGETFTTSSSDAKKESLEASSIFGLLMVGLVVEKET
jgi:hypothetical protein